MNCTDKKITFKATFTDSICGPVLCRLTRSGRAVDLHTPPAAATEYLCVSRDNPNAPWRFDDGGPVTWDRFVSLDAVKESRRRKDAPRRATVEFTLDRSDLGRSDLAEQLPKTWRDGAHCGLTDWYDPLEAAIVAALARGRGHAWTTGWYASKKEIASACITCAGGEIVVEVSVSDDFDTQGRGKKVIRFTTNLDRIRAAIDDAWSSADDDRRDSRVYEGFSVGRGDRWEYTLILPAGIGHDFDAPPGDNYHRWGWQEVEDGEDRPAGIPAEVAEQLLAWAKYEAEAGYDEITIGEWTARRWED